MPTETVYCVKCSQQYLGHFDDRFRRLTNACPPACGSRHYSRQPADEVAAMCEQNQNLAWNVVTKFIFPYEEYRIDQLGGRDAFFSSAMAAMLRAARGFDKSKGIRFSTYATTAMKRSMAKHVEEMTLQGATGIPVRLDGRTVDYHSAVSLDMLREAAEDQAHNHQEFALAKEEPFTAMDFDDVRRVLAKVREPFQSVLRWRYFEGLHPRQIGERLNVTRQRAIQMVDEGVSVLGELMGNGEMMRVWMGRNRGGRKKRTA